MMLILINTNENFKYYDKMEMVCMMVNKCLKRINPLPLTQQIVFQYIFNIVFYEPILLH